MNREENKIFHIGLGFGVAIGIVLTLGIQWIYLTKTKMSKGEIPEITFKLQEVIIKSECRTCKTTPLEKKEWYKGHWGCIQCGDPNKPKQR